MASLITSKKADVWSFPAVPIGICTYETVAVIARHLSGGSSPIPTLTQVMHKRPWLKPLFVGTLAWHLLNEKE